MAAVAAPGWEGIACKFALEGEGVKFASGVEGVWINRKGAAEAEFGGMPFLEDADADDDDTSILDRDAGGTGLRCVTKRWTI